MKIPALMFVRSGLSEGLSANASYRAYQAAAAELGATGLRRQDYLRLYSQTRNLRARAPEAVDQPKNAPPETISPRDTEHATGYGSWVAIFQRTSGTSDFISTPFLIKTSQPITPEEAEARALAFLQTAPDQYNRITLGLTYTGTEIFNPRTAP